ncbi:hypothetical protein LWE61_13680 [Sphingobium sufflavum]|uniref:hypothetical protein n=1 Tax=Sphingobium sufflavum TaxID=1129547 RepID=UPI001F1EDA88|nr:hypothetical protein [Sphingobium sufflavum]MCE7797597.1 hypothetical protein [Sphingobium sufflavum]
MTVTDSPDRDVSQPDPAADSAVMAAAVPVEARAVALHNLYRLRQRHFISPAMADDAMGLMLTLFISACQDMAAGEQSLLLANRVAPLAGATLLDTLVQAGLVVVTGKMPGRRSVGLTPLGSARMRAYIADSSDLI